VKLSKNRRILVLAIIAAVLAAIFAPIIVNKAFDSVDNKYEVGDLALENDAIKSHFGKIYEFEFQKRGSKVAFKKNGLEGTYNYTVKGAIKNGAIKVSWFENNNKIFVSRIELIEPWKQSVTIWERNMRQGDMLIN